nr:zinc ribbon domain-containing protein [Pleurocapsa sp. PCC 7319]
MNSCCGESGGRKELDIREWECLFCNTIHDRDINAAKNLNQWAGGQSDQSKKRDNAVLRDSPLAGFPRLKELSRAGVSPMSDCRKNGRGSKCQTTTVAVCVEPSTTPKQLTLF